MIAPDPPLEAFCIPLLRQKIESLTKERDDALLRLSDAADCEKHLRDTLETVNKERDEAVQGKNAIYGSISVMARYLGMDTATLICNPSLVLASEADAIKQKDAAEADLARLQNIVAVNDQRLADLADEKNARIKQLESFLDDCKDELQKEQESQSFWMKEANKMCRERDEALASNAALRSQIDELEVESNKRQEESDKLRGILAKSNLPCIYCNLADMGECKKGFPGCGRMDDIMADEARNP